VPNIFDQGYTHVCIYTSCN